MRIAFPALLRRFPKLALAEDFEDVAVPLVPFHLRAAVTVGAVVTVHESRPPTASVHPSGNCVMVAEEVFDQDDDGIVVVLAEEVPGEQATTRAKPSSCVRRCVGDDRA